MKSKIKKIGALLVTALLVCALALSACGDRGKDGGGTDSDAAAYNKRLVVSTELCKSRIDTKEVFHDQADVFMDPVEPTSSDDVTIRLRLRRGTARKVTLQFTLDLKSIASDTAVWTDIPMQFEIADPTMYYDYYICVIPAQPAPYKYHFVIENDVQKVWYNGLECLAERDEGCPIDRGGDFYVMTDFSTPDWAKGATWYSIMPDTFYNGDTLNDKTMSSNFKQDTWGTAHATGTFSGGLSYFGGDMAGVREKIAYMKEFGVDGVFINPIWFAYHNAGYGAADMMQIDSCFGNDAMLTALADALHDEDMKIMLDGVFTYFTYIGTYFNQNNYYPLSGGKNPGDPYYELFLHDASGNTPEVWGNPRTDFSNKLTRDIVYAAPDSIMQYYIRNHGIDGWRLDVGSDLIGADPNNWGNATQIIQDMRRYLKDIDEDVLLCSEGGSGTMLTDYALDTMWNFDYYYSMQDFLTQRTSASTVYNLNTNLYATICNLPKPVANCSYNFTANHDMPRTLNATKGDMAKAMAATIVNFTFVGAPCVYFGEEVGMDTSAFFDSMIWDKDKWNYDMVTLYKALTSLRRDYAEAYRTGAVKDLELDEDDGMLGFARWKGDQKTVTVMNPFDDVRDADLDVHTLELPDGAVLTDYLSGRTYTVRGGVVTVKVPRGGIVLVNGKENKFAGKYAVSRTGETTGKIAANTDGSFILSGEGTLAGKADAVAVAALPLENNGGVSAKATKGGHWAILLRDDMGADAAFYGLRIDAQGSGKIVYRASKGGDVAEGASVNIPEGATVAAERGNDNRFAVYVNGAKVVGTEIYVAMDSDIYAGIAPLSGNATVEGFTVYRTQAQRAAAFESATDSMTYTVGAAAQTAADGILTIKGGEGVSARLSAAPMTDITVRTLLKSKPNKGSQGVSIWQSENNYILAGRIAEAGQTKLALVHMINGTASIYAAADDIAGDVYVQLEKVGYYYAAKISADGKTWHTLGTGLMCNYSELNGGVVNASSEDAVFDFFCFGNAVEDGVSLADHKYTGDVNYYSDTRGYNSPLLTQSATGGRWAYCPGGLRQTLRSATEATLAFGGSRFRSFKSDMTLAIEEKGSDGAYVEHRFGLSSASAYGAVRLNADGKLSVRWAGEELASYAIPGFALGTRYRITTVVNDEGRLFVYLGEDAKLVLQTLVEGYKQGTQTVVGSKCAFEITSYQVYHYRMDWLYMHGYFVAPVENYIILTSGPDNLANAAFLSVGLGNMLIGGNVRMQKLAAARPAVFGYLIGGLAGALPEESGILVSATTQRVSGKETTSVQISQKGVTLAEKQIDFDYQSFYMLVAVEGGKISLYIDAYVAGDENGVAKPTAEPTLTYDCGYALGGALQVYASRAKVILANCGVAGLGEGDDYREHALYKNRVIESPIVKTPGRTDAFAAAGANTLSYDFTDKRQIEAFTTYAGAWYVDAENRCLVGLGTGDWLTGVTVNAGTFTDYELSYKVNCHASGAWAGVVLNKTNWGDNHEDGGHHFYTNSDGRGVYYAQGQGNYGSMGSADCDADGYLSVTIKVYGAEDDKTISVRVGNNAAVTFKLTSANTSSSQADGYISFVAGNCVASFRDVTIRALNSDGSYKS